MRAPSPLPFPFNQSPFRFTDARDFGLTVGRLRARDLTSTNRGIRLPVAPTSIAERAAAFRLVLSDDQFFSHTTAAELLGLRLPEALRDETLHVTSVAPRRAPRARGITGHQVTRAPVVMKFGRLTVSHPLQVLLECSDQLGIDDLVVLGDGLIQRKQPWASTGRLDAAIDFHRNRRGHAALVAARGLMRSNTDSARETLLRLLLERAGFPEPEVNGEIRDRAGNIIAHGDLVYREYNTVVEYDGSQHFTDARQFSIDIERIDAILELGWRHIRVDKYLMAKRAVVIGKVDTALRLAGWRHPSPAS